MIKKMIRNRHGLRLTTLIQINPRARGLVFVMHGLGGNMQSPLIKELTSVFYTIGYTVVCFDTRNTIGGESGGELADATVTGYLHDLEDVIQWSQGQLWHQRKVVLVGASIGGLCVGEYAADHPESIERLLLIAPIVSGRMSTISLRKRGLLQLWKQRGWREMKSSTRPGESHRLNWSHMVDRMKYDLLKKAHTLKMPTLLIVGDKDATTPKSHVALLFKALPKLKQMEVIPGAPHIFHNPDHLKSVSSIIKTWIGPDLRLTSKRVTVMGLGLHGGGIAAARWAQSQGARVTVTDLRSRHVLAESIKQLSKKNITYVLGRHRMVDATQTDLVIQNPGVPNYSPYILAARRAQVPVENELSIFYQLSKSPIIGVTGTKGKSTVTQLIYEILKRAKKHPLIGGNIRISPFDLIAKTNPNKPAVLEMSSFQLEDSAHAKRSPHIAVVTNLLHDHLNRHKSMARYHEAKMNIFRFQNSADWTILNYDQPITRRWGRLVPGRRMWFSTHPITQENAVFIRRNMIYARIDGALRVIMPISSVGLRGMHNRSNILAAIAVAMVYDIGLTAIRAVVKQFTGLPGRMQVIRQWKGITFINDTTATIPDAALASLASIRSKVVLIAGGADKQLKFEKFAEAIARQCAWCILLAGTATDVITRILRRNDFRNYSVVHSMSDALKQAILKSEFHLPVMLSPGAASFGLFLNEFDRGEQFEQLVKQLP
ncbi:MAG: UDP-N-acetylmuramoyl-L-alanine--D-glutamate ligase [Patescibacteria group bacterium]